MSSILLIGAANAETHVATKGYADTHVAGAQGQKAAQTDSGKIIKMGWDSTNSKPTYEFVNETTLTAGDDTVTINNNQITGNYEGTAPINITGNTVSVATATDSTLGVVKAGDATEIGNGGGVNVLYDGTTITKNGFGQLVAADSQYKSGTNVTVDTTADTDGKYKINVADATTDTAGVVKYDGTTITKNTNGQLVATDTTYEAGNNVSVADTDSNGIANISVADATDSVAGVVKYDGTTITKNTSGQLVAVDTLPADGTATAITDTNKVNVKYDGSTITVNANNELQGNYQGTTNQISISGNTIGLDITTACPENTRCALTTNVAGQLVWEPLTTTDVADTNASPHTNAMYND